MYYRAFFLLIHLIKKKKSYFIAFFRMCGPCIFLSKHLFPCRFAAFFHRALFKNSGDTTVISYNICSGTEHFYSVGGHDDSASQD